MKNNSIHRFFDDGHSDRCEVICHCSFDLHFSNSGVEPSVSLEKSLFRSLTHFLIGFLVYCY